MVLQLSDAAFKRLSKMVYDEFRILLNEGKRALIVSRLSRYIQTLGLDSFDAYLDYVVSGKGEENLSTLVNRISTNYTFFYREPAHFDFFQNTILRDIERGSPYAGQRIRIWVAGCSSGEEPWMLAINLSEFFKANVNQRAAILATDISARALKLAKEGTYTADNTSHLPTQLRKRYFDAPSADRHRVKNSLRSLVTYRRLNLNREAFPFKKKFHVIFCRNVMIYFDHETRMKLVQQYYDQLEPGGYLIIGHSESLGRSTKFDYVQPAVYRKPVGG